MTRTFELLSRICRSLAPCLLLLLTSCVSMLGSQRTTVAIPERQNYSGAPLTGDISKIEAQTSELHGRYGREYKSEVLNQTTTEFNLRGDVLSVLSCDDEYSQGESRQYAYNDEGRLVMRTEKFASGGYEHRYTLDEYGCVVLHEVYDESGVLESSTSIEYDLRGNDVEYVTRDGIGRERGVVVRIFNEANLLAELIRYSGDEEVRGRETYSYDDAGLLVESVVYEGYDMLQRRVVVEYGDNGCDRVQITYNDQDEVVEHYAESYDAESRLVERCEYDAQGVVVERMSMSYDAAGRKLSETLLGADDKPLKVRTYSYNEDGLLAEEVEDDLQQKTYSLVVYAYDDRGNLVEERAYLTKYKVPQYIVEYAITYRE